MSSVIRTALAVATLAACLDVSSALEAAAPFTIVTKDGQRVEVLDPPRNTGKSTTFRMYPEGRLASFPSARIDWKATEAANAAPAAPSATPVPTPPGAGPRLSALAREMTIDEGRANSSGDTMKLKSGKAADMYETGPYFGEKSVAKHLTAGSLAFSAAGCPSQRAVFAGTVTNTSRKKLRHLKALVALADVSSGTKTERIESLDPPNLAPGEDASILLYVSCDYANASSRFAAVLRDISGTAEDLEKAGRENPFAKPAGETRK